MDLNSTWGMDCDSQQVRNVSPISGQNTDYIVGVHAEKHVEKWFEFSQDRNILMK